ncbi:TlpA disulfide reductase family protein [Sediminibacterium goheungense]|uniref:Thioredoxin-like protein n=1 Tax=Sediminibacterium goheungense TaxID=1086393 RepID=A0A4R6IXF4_9BACT|nr:TlpA disulfide reductase family protein [Sediminibacterium goheungense]TDO26565.1 thioredoxin-like protein [Sediminibacterium goheungense]
MKTIQFILINILLCNCAFGQVDKNAKSAILNGTLWPFTNDTIIINYYPYKLGITVIGSTEKKIVTSDGNFRIKITDMDHPYYCSIKSTRLQGLLFIDQLIEPGDSISIKAEQDSYKNYSQTNLPFLKITGRNAAKNQAIHLFDYARLYNKISGIKKNLVERYTNLAEAILVFENNEQIYRAYWDSLTKANTSDFSEQSKKIIESEFTIGKINGIISTYSALKDKLISKKSSEKDIQQLNTEFASIINPMLQELLTNSTTSTVSPKFLDIAVRKTMLDTKIMENNNHKFPAIKYVHGLEQWPENKREAIATALLAYIFIYNSNTENIQELLAKVGTMVYKPELKAIVENFQKKYTPGIAVPPFSLTGLNGEKINSQDYIDKVVVLDFWFTGCDACVTMARVLRLAKDRLAGDPDIVFMSISIDTDRETWLNSVSKGIYSHADFVNAYTNGMGMEHSLIQQYQIQAYPRVMIMGKGNKMFKSNPHMPKNRDEVELLVQDIIDAKKK